MAKFVLFSEPNEKVLDQLAKSLFTRLGLKIAYIPSVGDNPNNPKYSEFWQNFVESNGGKFSIVDNSIQDERIELEKAKIQNSDAIILTGGNTFHFLHNLKQSGLDETITDFAKAGGTVVGYSAGAILLSPTIEIALLPPADENTIGLTDLTGLGLIDLDIYPHYDESKHKEIVDEYEKTTGRAVERLRDEDMIVVEN